MQSNISLGLLETSSIAKGIECVDVMLKTAEVSVLKAAAVAKGKYFIIITGSVGEVESALRSGVENAGSAHVADYIIRNAHKDVVNALDNKNAQTQIEAVGIVETKDIVPAVFSADSACKASKVNLIEIKLGSGIGGKGCFIVSGEPGSVRTSVSAGVKAIGEELIVSKIVINQAHKDMLKVL